MSAPALTQDQNLLPVQAYFDVYGNFQTFIGQGQPFTATISPIQSGLTITNSTINSTTIGLVTPSSGAFTNVQTTTGSISTAPSSPTDIVNKQYVDAFAAGLSWKQPVLVATTANITLSGLQTIDTISVTSGSRVLVKNQSNQAQNGLYIASSGAWSYATDGSTWNEYVSAIVFIEQGTQAGQAWYCYVQPGGTLGTTAITWSQFSSGAVYYAGTGLTLSGYTFSITPVGTAGTYGSASSVPVFTTNASGQVTSVTNTSISIAPSQINATIPNSGLTNSSLTVNGTLISLGGSGAITATASNALTIGTGLSGTSYNGSTPVTVAIANTAVTAGSYTIGNFTVNAQGQLTAASNASTTGSGNVVLATSPTLVTPNLGTPSTLVGTNITGTASALNIGGNAATATSATSATSATNLSGGTTYALPYQSGVGATSFLASGTANQVLITNGSSSAPSWTSSITLTSGSFGTLYTTGLTGYLYGNGASVVTASTTIPTSALSGQVSLANGGTNANLTAVAGGVVYSGASALAITAAGSSGQFLQSTGSGAPIWATPASYATVTDDTTTNGTRYPLFANQTSGNLATEYTSSTKLQYNPNTGIFTSTGFSGAHNGSIGATTPSTGSFTTVSATGQITSTVATGTAPFVVSSTTPVANLSIGGNAATATSATTAGSATTATTATNALNIQVTDSTTSSSTFYPTMSPGTTGSTNYALGTSSTKLSFVPNTGTLTSTVVSGGAIIATETITGSLNQGAFSYGTLGYTDIDIFGSYTMSVNNYAQKILQNTNNGTKASADFIVSNNNGTASTYYGDFGITSSGYNNLGQNITNNANAVYLQTQSTDLYIGTLTSNAIHFIVNTGSSDALTISTAGNVTTPNVLTGAEVSASNGIFINNKTVGASYSIPSGYAASSVGPVTLSNGVTVTVPSGSKWVVL